MQRELEHNQVAVVFILSLISGMLISLQGCLRVIRTQWGLELGIGEFRRYSLGGLDYKILGIVSIIIGVMVIVGALLLRKPDRARQGAITVIVFSAISILSGGGFIVGLIFGVIGGVLALTNYSPESQSPAKNRIKILN
jgi:hypothetical protein